MAVTALEVLQNEKMAENAASLGEYFRDQLKEIKSPHIKHVRGKGLLNAILIEHANDNAAWDLCLKLKDNGLLAKPTHGDIIRLAPPLVITKSQIDECVEIIRESLSIL